MDLRVTMEKTTVKKTAGKISLARKNKKDPDLLLRAAGAVIIKNVSPEIDGGKFPAKCVVGESVLVEADIYKEGHDVLGACVKFRKKDVPAWQEAPMVLFDNDRWHGHFTPVENTRYVFTVEAWMDTLETWRRHTEKKCLVHAPVASDVLEGLMFFNKSCALMNPPDFVRFERFIESLKKANGRADKVLPVLQDVEFQNLLAKYPLKDFVTVYEHELELTVDRKQAEFAAWYEFFPRSQGRVPGRHGTFRDCIARLPEIKKMGFDVLYLPPIHPIGVTNRKGPNNTLVPPKNSPGSPWAIGNRDGGHKAVHPELGTLEDFKEFVAAAKHLGMEIALDIAYQCSPDHPYVTEHPEWFYHLPDGSIRCAENPPKKYEDIYPLNLNCEEKEALWKELESIILFWIDQGVKTFRVDNPHTKPLAFWEWMFGRVQEKHPEIIFLSEAFTRPKMMKSLAKAGFTQSYTYFTWRNTKHELRPYLEELTQTEMKHYFRGNFFANTPDILHEYLQKGGRPAFMIRLVLAATLSSVYGIYSSFEICENRAKAHGSEEYLNSEKYELKAWDWDRPGNIRDYIARVNRIRRENPALQQYKNLEFYPSRNESILCYGKRTPDNSNIIVVAVNLDPFVRHEDMISLPLWKLGLEDGQSYQMKDLLSGAVYIWRGQDNYISLDPLTHPAHIFQLKK